MKQIQQNAQMAFARRRNRILKELYQMKNDVDHWNETHPNEEPIIIDFDLMKNLERVVKRVAGDGK